MSEIWCQYFKQQTRVQFGSDNCKVIQTCAVTMSFRVTHPLQNCTKWGEGEIEIRTEKETEKQNGYPKWDSCVGKLFEGDIKG